MEVRSLYLQMEGNNVSPTLKHQDKTLIREYNTQQNTLEIDLEFNFILSRYGYTKKYRQDMRLLMTYKTE